MPIELMTIEILESWLPMCFSRTRVFRKRNLLKLLQPVR